MHRFYGLRPNVLSRAKGSLMSFKSTFSSFVFLCTILLLQPPMATTAQDTTPHRIHVRVDGVGEFYDTMS